MPDAPDFKPVQAFYDGAYYAALTEEPHAAPWHYGVVAKRFGDLSGRRVLDVACGSGEWLALLAAQGAEVAGIDISEKAIAHCRARFPGAEFHHGPAESLPFPDGAFDLVTCLGSLEHFLDKPKALAEMVRVSKPDAQFLILVPNAGFLTRRLGLYRGTQQVLIREDVLPLAEWTALLEGAGLRVDARWRDLHVLDAAWIKQGPAWSWPVRALQAASLPFWPIAWQYQVHHLCRRREAPATSGPS